MVSPQTGEQAFGANLDEGTITLYLGASTTSGPIRNVGLKYIEKNNVWHEPAWYSEPFHGEYHHRIILQHYNGTWQQAHLPQAFRCERQPVYTRECHPGNGTLPTCQSLVETTLPNIDITTIDDEGQGTFLRLNEREGHTTKARISIGRKTYKANLKPYGIVTLPLR